MTICISILLQRKAGLTKEEFDEKWKEHAEVVKNVPIFRETFSRYQQIFISPEYNETLEKLGVTTTPCDGIAQMHVESLEKFFAFSQHPDYANIISPDEDRFLEKKDGRLVGGIVLGDLAVKWDAGKL